jgi:shikimate kinase
MSHRPLLKSQDPKAVLTQLLKEREVFYNQSDLIVNGVGTVDRVCREILEALENKGIRP